MVRYAWLRFKGHDHILVHMIKLLGYIKGRASGSPDIIFILFVSPSVPRVLGLSKFKNTHCLEFKHKIS